MIVIIVIDGESISFSVIMKTECDGVQITQAEEAVKDNHPIEKCFVFLFHDENDHWHICPQYQSTCNKLSQPQQQQH